MKDQNDATESAQVMDLAALLEEHSGGDVNRYLSEKLSEVIAAVKATQKVGKLKIEFSIKPEAHLAKVDISSKVELPQPALPGALYFFRGDTALTRDDPKQLRIDLRSVGGEKKPIVVRDAEGTREVRDVSKKSDPDPSAH